jgi:hypothetical protein
VGVAQQHADRAGVHALARQLADVVLDLV